MKIMLAQYVNRENDIKTFIYDPVRSYKEQCDCYHCLINGLFVVDSYTRIELMMLMDNGYEWITHSIKGCNSKVTLSNHLTEEDIFKH